MTSSAPRVVFLGHSAQPSGAELGLLRLTRAMTRYEPVVVLAEQGPLVEQLRSAGVRCEVLELSASVTGVRHAEIKLGSQIVAAAREVYEYGRELGQVLHALNPDIVDTFTLKAHIFGRLAERSTQPARRVAHVHDRLTRDYMRRPSIALLRVVLGRCDGLVFNSTSTFATVPSLRRGQVRVIVGSAIDRPSAIAVDRSSSREFVFACVGRLAPWKGQELALNSFAALRRRSPGRDLRLRFIGGSFFGEQAYITRLRALTDELGLTGSVEWVGHVSDVYSELTGVDALLHCSILPEPFGQVVVEGMAYGVPVIVSAEGGPAELVTDDVTGFAFVPRDAQSLTETMERAVALPAGHRRAMTQAARGVAERYYSEHVARSVELFYDEVLNPTGSGRR